MNTKTLTPERLHSMGAYWRAANYLSVVQGWYRYAGLQGEIIGVESFGASAPGDVVLREFGFTVENVCERAVQLMAARKE